MIHQKHIVKIIIYDDFHDVGKIVVMVVIVTIIVVNRRRKS